MRAAASSKAYAHTHLGFGLMQIPVDVYSGTTSSGISRKEFTQVTVTGEDGTEITVDHSVGRVPVDKETGKVIGPDRVVRKVATEFGFVYVSDEEIEKLFDLQPNSIQVKAFQPVSLWRTGRYVGKSLYYVTAAKTKLGKAKVPDPQAQVALQLVLSAMEQENAIAIVDLVTRGVPKPAVLLPSGELWTLYFEEELREAPETPTLDVPDAAVNQALTIIRMGWSVEARAVTDARSALIQEFADNKAKAGDFSQPVESEPQARQVSTSDLMSLLAASVDAARAAREERKEDAG